VDILACVLDRAARGDTLQPAALIVLLRQYRRTGRQDICDLLGDALAAALARHTGDRTTIGRAGWLNAFVEAAAVTEDARVGDAARALTAALANEWPSIAFVDQAAISIDACLAASHLGDPRALIPRAVDELERVVAGGYRPGAGVSHTIDGRRHERGGLSDHVRLASALITAYAATARLPYSMLAEELMQVPQDWLGPGADVVLSCEAARTLCRLAALHDDDEYRRAAVIRAGADYRADAGRILEQLSPRLTESGCDVALYGLALDEWRASP
jgi:hypothetical protein